MSQPEEPATSDEVPDLSEALTRINRHMLANRLNAASKLIDEMKAALGRSPQLFHVEGLVRYRQGDVETGLDLLRRADAENQDNAALLGDIGAVLAQEGRLDEALTYFEQVTDLAPNYAGGWANLGAAFLTQQNYQAAEKACRKATELDSSNSEMQRNLGMALQCLNRFKEAVDAFYRGLAIDANDPKTHCNLAAALFRAERHDAAVHHARKSLEIDPGALEPHLHLGSALASMGKMQEAEQHLMKAASRMPTAINALSRLIHLRKTKPDSPEFKTLQRLEHHIETMGLDPKASFHMAAGKAYFDLEDFEVSFEHFAAGNAVTAKIHHFNRQNAIDQVDRMIDLCTPKLIETISGRAGLTDIKPIFVCGMPRSGTTLMEQMLSGHSRVRAGGELNASRQAFAGAPRLVHIMEEKLIGDPRPDDFNLLAEAYVDAVRREGVRGEVFTDKLPINYLYIGLLALALPGAKFVIMRRHPMACCLSNWMQNFGQNQPFATDFQNLATVYRGYDRLTKHWTDLLPDRTRIVPYEDLVGDARGTLETVASFCGLGWEDGLLDHVSATRPVNTASVSQVRQPLYSTSLEHWKRFGPLVKDLAIALADQLSEEDRVAAGIVSQ